MDHRNETRIAHGDVWNRFSYLDVEVRQWMRPRQCPMYLCRIHPSQAEAFVQWRKTILKPGEHWIADFCCTACRDAGYQHMWTACVLCGSDGATQPIVPQDKHTGWSLQEQKKRLRQHLKKKSHQAHMQHVHPDARPLRSFEDARVVAAQAHAMSNAHPHGEINAGDSVHATLIPDEQQFFEANEFHNPKSQWYFTKDYNTGEGARALVIKCQTNVDNDPKNGAWMNEDVDLGFRIAEFAIGLSQFQQAQFAEILGLHAIQVERNIGRRTTCSSIPESPHEYSTIRSQYTEGRNSFYQNLPHPLWQTTEDGIAYASIAECIQDFLAHGFEFDEIRPPDVPGVVRTPGESPFAQEILRRAQDKGGGNRSPAILLYLIMWEDDYEANQNQKEQNHTAYKKTLTISPSPKEKHPQAFTYPLVLGPKGDMAGYEIVERYHNAELEKLAGTGGEKMYSKAKLAWVDVHAEVLAVMGDQPARRTAHYLRGSGSLIHGRFGYIVNHNEIWAKVPSCACCRGLLKLGDQLPAQCEDCVSWDAHRHATKLSFQELALETVSLRKRYLTGGVTQNDALKEMISMGISKNGASKLCGIADDQKFVQEQNLLGNMHRFRAFNKKMQAFPYLFDVEYVFAAWSRPHVTVSHVVEAVMHLLFLGIVKDTMLKVHDWLKCYEKKASFLSIIETKVDGMGRVNISWCKAKTYGKTGKFGGKISENYMADGRLLLWIMLWVSKAQTEDRVDPQIPLAGWLKQHYITWHAHRGLPHKGKSIDELKESYHGFINQPTGPPKHSVKNGGPEENVYHMLMSLYALLPRVMTDHVTDEIIADTERHIRIFLDAFEEVDRAIREGSPPCQKEPGVPVTQGEKAEARKAQSASKGNHLCLMNLRDMMKNLGPLRNYWDGDSKAEASIRDSKLVQTGRGVDPKHVMRKEMLLNSIRRIKWCLEKQGIALGSQKPHRFDYKYLTYTQNDFLKPWMLANNEKKWVPCSCVWYHSENSFWIQFKDKTEQQLEIGRHHDTLNGLEYFFFEVRSDVLPNDRRGSRIQNARDPAAKKDAEYCLLLPLPPPFIAEDARVGFCDDDGNDYWTYIFTPIGNNWTVLTRDKSSMRWFRIPGYNYTEHSDRV